MAIYKARYKSPGKAPPYDGKEWGDKAYVKLEVDSVAKKVPAATIYKADRMGAPEAEWSKCGEWSQAEGWMWYDE